MTTLSTFDDNEQALLISLPYKAGMYVSHAEDEEGEQDDEKEMRALEHCLKSIAKLHEDRPFVYAVTTATLSERDQWNMWADDSFKAPEDAKKVMAILRAKSTPKDFKQYRSMIMQISATVARAYGEFGDNWDDDDEEGFFKNVINKVVDGFSSLSDEDNDHPANISPAEESALSALSKALDPKNL